MVSSRKLNSFLLIIRVTLTQPQVNRAPSFGTDEKIDLDIKSGLLTDAFRLINMRTSDKRKGMAAQKAESQKRLLRPTKRISSDANVCRLKADYSIDVE